MKDRKPHPCRRCKDGIVKFVNVCPKCLKEIADQLRAHYQQFDKEPQNVVEL